MCQIFWTASSVIFPGLLAGVPCAFCFVHPNYHSGGAEIAGNWPPAWVAYLSGALKAAGYSDILFVDAMTNDIGDERLREIIRETRPEFWDDGDHAFDLQGRTRAADRQG